jgi:hypothetical protein
MLLYISYEELKYDLSGRKGILLLFLITKFRIFYQIDFPK